MASKGTNQPQEEEEAGEVMQEEEEEADGAILEELLPQEDPRGEGEDGEEEGQ